MNAKTDNKIKNEMKIVEVFQSSEFQDKAKSKSKNFLSRTPKFTPVSSNQIACLFVYFCNRKLLLRKQQLRGTQLAECCVKNTLTFVLNGFSTFCLFETGDTEFTV